MKINKIITIMVISIMMSGCLLTKVVTVPMRVVGGVISVVPVVGGVVDDAIDITADVIDTIPL